MRRRRRLGLGIVLLALVAVALLYWHWSSKTSGKVVFLGQTSVNSGVRKCCGTSGRKRAR